ncbi:MAG: CoA transferase [Minwuia sp.]|nr:CoA transferase [Minwuia sp.]
MTTARQEEPRPILSGVRVIDAATWIAGPTAATVMADFGADVIKVEPPGGDGFRRLNDTPGFPKGDTDYAWQLDNHSKRGIIMDLGQDADRARMRALVASADVFITNHPLPVRRKFGLTWDELSPINLRLIYASLTAKGEVGPEADGSGFDMTTYWARSGLMHLVRPDMAGPPALSVAGQGDHPTGIALFGAVMLGLYERTMTGRGREVHTSLIANGLWSNAVLATAVLAGAPLQNRRPRNDPWTAMVNYYETRDGRWFIVSALDPQRDFTRLVQVIERPDLLDDPRFATVEARSQNAAALTRIFDAAFLQRDWAEWRVRLGETRLAVGPVLTPEEAADDSQARAIGVITDTADGALLSQQIDTPIWVSGQEKARPRRAPGPDEHGDAIRAALNGGGLPWEG